MSPRPGLSWVGCRVKMLMKVCAKPLGHFKGVTSILTGRPDRHSRRDSVFCQRTAVLTVDLNLLHHRLASNEENVRFCCFSFGADRSHARHADNCVFCVKILPGRCLVRASPSRQIRKTIPMLQVSYNGAWCSRRRFA